MKITVTENYAELSRETARSVAEFINGNPGALLCFAAGDTPLGTFAELIRMQEKGEVDLSAVFYAGLDEWVGLGPHDKGSCHQVMFGNFYAPAKIPRERIRVFDGLANPADECAAMGEWLDAKGGIGLTLLGVGMNGHIGFNEPANQPENSGRQAIVVPLDEVTQSVGRKYFDGAPCVPTGITIALPTLFKARRILVMACGEHKAPIIRQSFTSPPTPALPASLLRNHPDLTLLLDKQAHPEAF